MTRRTLRGRLEAAEAKIKPKALQPAYTLQDLLAEETEEFSQRAAKGYNNDLTFLGSVLCEALPEEVRQDLLCRGRAAVCQFKGAAFFVRGAQTLEEKALAAYKRAAQSEYWPPLDEVTT